VKRPDFKNTTGMILDGIFSSEAIDSSGEVVKLEGMDISSMEDGESIANYEHKNKDNGGDGREIVGRIVYVRKIFNKDDCEDQRQEFWFEKSGGKPYLYGAVRLLDAAGHKGAESLAAQVRDAVKHDDKILVRYSVEGTTLERDSNVIKTSIARQVAITLKPCNKTCFSAIVSDPNAPDGFSKNPQDVLKADLMPADINRKIGGSSEHEGNPIVSDSRSDMDRLVSNLRLLKTLTAGSYDVAPSSLTGGAALQKENIGSVYKSHIVSAIKDYKKPWNKKEFKKFLKARLDKAALPEVSDSFLDHFSSIAEDFSIKKSVSKITLPNLEGPFLDKINLLQAELVDLRKSLRDTLQGYNVQLPEVYLVQMKVGQSLCPAGRFMIAGNQVFHLEDYHHILDTFAPEGPVTQELYSNLHILQNSGNFTITENTVDDPPQPSVSVSQQQPPQQPPVFEYFRPGMQQPHILEFSNNQAALDGEALTPEELALILENIKTGLATIKFKASSSLLKAEMDIQAATEALRKLVASGHAPPELERAFTKHVYHDPMVADVGNKFAWSEFLKANKPGVYGSLDVNNFKHINDTHGHPVGDEAIKHVGGALRDAANKAGRVKLFRSGGDEFAIHAETPEDAHTFLRTARANMEAIPPIKGVHQPSFSVGLGHDFSTADKALLEAKKGKIDPVSSKPLYHPAKTPHFGHSLIPGQEGPINMSGASAGPAPQQP
jgi:diguanylate cyclase (GGDEF)-like protein